MNTKGDSLLSGNVFCGHCGARLTLTTNGKKYQRKDGNVTITPKTRYVCYNKTRHPEMCDGQTGYTAKKLDSVIEAVILKLFQTVLNLPREELIEGQFDSRLSDLNAQLVRAKAELKAEVEIRETLEGELIKVIQGTSILNAEMLNKKYAEAQDTVALKQDCVDRHQRELEDSKALLESIRKQYENLETWSAVFSDSAIEVKKMIVSQIISAVRVSRDYRIDIDFNISFEQFGVEM
jgi:hypothetical protein